MYIYKHLLMTIILLMNTIIKLIRADYYQEEELDYMSNDGKQCNGVKEYYDDAEEFDNFRKTYFQCDYYTPLESDIKINVYKQITVIPYSPKPFASACVKCLMCITVAQELHKTFVRLHDRYPPAPMNMLTPDRINHTIRNLCENSFKNFDFREKNGDRFLTNNIKGTINVPTSMNGLWSIKLKEMCLDYLDIRGEWYLYMRWFEASRKSDFDFVQLLCRSYGIYQHCRNLPL